VCKRLCDLGLGVSAKIDETLARNPDAPSAAWRELRQPRRLARVQQHDLSLGQIDGSAALGCLQSAVRCKEQVQAIARVSVEIVASIHPYGRAAHRAKRQK